MKQTASRAELLRSLKEARGFLLPSDELKSNSLLFTTTALIRIKSC